MRDEIAYWETYKIGDVTIHHPVPLCQLGYLPPTRKDLQDTIDAYMRPTNCCGKSEPNNT